MKKNYRRGFVKSSDFLCDLNASKARHKNIQTVYIKVLSFFQGGKHFKSVCEDGVFGTDKEGKDRLVHMLFLYNADSTGMYVITLNHGAEDEFFTLEVNDQIINSITLADEAQHLAYEE